MINLNWIKCSDGNWCDLFVVDLNHEHFRNLEGVYIVWHGGHNPWTVKVGQGNIKDRLAKHRIDKDILVYRSYNLWVTWAKVDLKYRDGIEAYLANTLSPKVGERFPNRFPIIVNLPW